jgi:NHLM bacteriocin system ABC transporter peptidase/ATP-binding protein
MKSKRVVSTPVILQMEALECGAACLTMILAYYKSWIPLEKVRSDCGVSRDGSKAINIVKAARNYGFETTVKKYTPERIMEVGKFPCIIWWEEQHFVVLNGFKNGNVFLNDPAYGKVKIPYEEFVSSYSGIYIYMEPTVDYVPRGEKKSPLRFLAGRVKDNKVGYGLITVTALVVAVCEILVPMFSDLYTSRALGQHDKEAWIGLLFVLGITGIYYLLIGGVNVVVSIRTAGRLAVASNIRYIMTILGHPLDFFSQRMSGDLAERQSENDTVARILTGTFAPLVIQIAFLGVYVGIMLKYSVLLTAIGILAVLIDFCAAFMTNAKRTDVLRVTKRDEGKVEGVTVMGISMIETIKASGAENGFFEQWAGNYASYLTSRSKFTKINRILTPFPALVENIALALEISAGAGLIITGNITEGSFVAIYGLLGGAFKPVEKLLDSQEDIQEMHSDMERIDDVINYPTVKEPESITDEELRNAQKLDGNVKIENVTFGYSKLGEPIIEDFSLEIEKGSRVAIVGGSGSGKSTLAKLLTGLYSPWKGQITFDGKTIDEIPKEVFKASVSMVDQNQVMFEDSIGNNIKMWDETIEDYDMILAARDAQIHEDIIDRKGGYNSSLLENGKNLSGGQKQRLEIARALSVEPSIIILDEATSALDAKTEFEVARSITNRGITCIIIAHRLSTIRDCDRIIVLDDGEIVEEGTHDELLAKEGYYSRLVRTE